MPLIAPKPTRPQQQPKQPKPQTRSGSAAGGQFAAQHPRGRGGKWIVKPGDGYGAGPNQTTAQLQQRLNQLGFHVPVDGKYGPATANAVQTFQKRYGLSPSKGVDAATMAFLQNPPAQTIAQIQKSKGTTSKSSTRRISARSASAGTPGTPGTRGGTSTAITPAQAAGQVNVSNATQGAIKAAVVAANEAHQAKTDTNVKNAQHDAAQAQAAAARAQKLASQAKAAAVGGSAQAQRTAKSAQRVAKTAQRNARGAIKAVNALKRQIAKQNAARIARAQALKPGEYAGLARKAPKAPAGRKPKMKLSRPKKGSKPPSRTGKVQVATSAYGVGEQPELEESVGNGAPPTTTIAFGYGGGPSLAIPDGREQTPIFDQPIWTRTGIRIPPLDLTIPDGREDVPQPPAGANFTIPDGRSVPEVLTVQLVEAIAARKAATTGQEFTRALARERVLRAWLQEAFWNQSLHPRGRGGKWIDVMNKLMGAPPKRPEHMVHLEDMGDDYLNARLHPNSGAAKAERQKIREIQARRRSITGVLRRGSGGLPRALPSAERPLSKVQRPLSQVQKPLAQIQRPLSKTQRSLSDIQKPLY